MTQPTTWEGRAMIAEAALRRIRDQEPDGRPWVNPRIIANEALGGTGMPSPSVSEEKEGEPSGDPR